MGCTACHTIETKGEKTAIRLNAGRNEICATCHASAQDAVLHGPYKRGQCLTCHDTHTSDFPKMLRAETNALCLSCHGLNQPGVAVNMSAQSVTLLGGQKLSLEEYGKAKKIGPDISGRGAPPIVGHPVKGKDPRGKETALNCLSCHSPHGSANRSLVLKPASGGKAENLCLSCHGAITAQIAKSKQHPAVDAGCDTCHSLHKSGPAGTPEGVFHLTKAQPELCLDCHDAGEAKLQAAHQKQPFARARCAECHNPHGSDQVKLLNNYVHAPFADKQCEACHQEPKDGRIALVDGARRELCLVCHPAMQERLDHAKVTHAALAGASGCVACHSPHAANFPRQVRRGPVELCLICHSDLARARAEKTYLHQPVFNVSCMLCHQEHTGDRPKRLRAEVNALCLECHGPKAVKIVQASEPVALFNGQVNLPAKSFEDLKWLQLGDDGKRGHPFPNHPVSAPGEKDKSEINCLTCHLPHAANGSRQFLVTEKAGSSVLCARCH